TNFFPTSASAYAQGVGQGMTLLKIYFVHFDNFSHYCPPSLKRFQTKKSLKFKDTMRNLLKHIIIF
ncbi:hypothetical protein, partial [Acinetobacter baumannii]|uniref:hypothetical protein n=1 Tax=Acinetobacter baumannii TaxID=470 RepID=UPI001C067CA7